MMSKALSTASIKQVVLEAFKAVKKENGVGPREAATRDSKTSAAEVKKARQEDIEENWYDIPSELRGSVSGYLVHVDEKSFRFLLPAAMTAALEQKDEDEGFYIFCSLCVRHPLKQSPDLGTREYLNYLKEIKAVHIARKYQFSDEQIRAIGLFFLWWMNSEGTEYLPENREDEIDSLTQFYKKSEFDPKVQNEISIRDEESRILFEWVTLKA